MRLFPSRTLGASIVALLVALTACDRGREPAPDPRTDPFKGLELMQAMGKPDFTLTSIDGTTFKFREQTDGHLTLLFFGYTHCPDVCPLHMANIGSVLRQQPPEVTSRVKVVFVTTDPERDTPEVLRTFLDRFSPQIIGLTGTPEELSLAQQAARLLPAYRDTVNLLGSGGYSVGHAAQVLAYTADDSLRLMYPFGIRQEDWAYDIPRLVRVGAPR